MSFQPNSKLTTIVTAVFLLTLGGSGWWWYKRPSNQIEAAVRSKLLDPDSANFYEFKVNRSTGYGCGYVNSKNTVGGYAGKRSFVATTSGEVHFDPELKEPDPPTDLPDGPLILPRSNDPEVLLADAMRRSAENDYKKQRLIEWRQKADEVRETNLAYYNLVKEKCPE